MTQIVSEPVTEDVPVIYFEDGQDEQDDLDDMTVLLEFMTILTVIEKLSSYLVNFQDLSIPEMKQKLFLFKNELKTYAANCRMCISQIKGPAYKNMMIDFMKTSSKETYNIHKRLVNMLRIKNSP